MKQSVRMHWNLGGWIGAQLGGSVWMLVAGLLSFSTNPTTALTVIIFFALANLIGAVLWARRDRLSPYLAIQILLPVLGIFGFAAVFVLDRSGIYETIQIGGTISAQATYIVIVLVVTALMLMFYYRFGRRSKKNDEVA